MIPEFPGDVRLCLSVLSASIHRKRKRFTVNSVHRFTQGVDNFFHSSFLICFMSKSAVEPGKIF